MTQHKTTFGGVDILRFLAAVSSDIDPIIPLYDLYTSKADWINQKWTELIVG